MQQLASSESWHLDGEKWFKLFCVKYVFDRLTNKIVKKNGRKIYGRPHLAPIRYNEG